MTPDEGQKLMDEWFINLPKEIEKFYNFLFENVKKFQTFDLLSYFAYYNHLHDSETYSDFRGDKNFIASEVLALLCLKSEFVNESTITEDAYMELIMEMQKTVLNYCGRNDALEIKSDHRLRGEDTIADVASLLSREARQIRNPGLPDHHLIFTEKLFEPIKDEIEFLFGFTVSNSVTIRNLLPDMINERCQTAIDEALGKADKLAKEIIKYRKAKTVEPGSVFSKEQLDEYCLLPDKQIKQALHNHLLNELFYTFSKIYTFTAEELSEFTNIELEAVKAFLKAFSCGFPSLKENDKIYEPITILKSKPFIEHDGRYLIPSFPLVTWAVEDSLFDELFSNKHKTTKSISDIRHDFVLEESYKYFQKLLPTACFFPLNLKYQFDGILCETDGLILYDRILFVIEAKGHRINEKAKEGNRMRTDRDLNRIVRNSYEQGIRVLKYISKSEVSEFKPKKGNKFEIARSQFDEVIIVSLTFEAIGNLSMSIKATNDIGYFNDGHFPWIISIYDLVVLADLFENPIMLIHYIKRREKFLSHKALSTYEELDLVSYFLSNGLYIEHILKDAEEKKANWIDFPPDTDAINDFYMFKFGHKTKFTGKPKCHISTEFNDFLLQLDHSKMPHRVRMALLLLEFNSKSIKQLMDYVKKTKKTFSKDKGIHDCSIYTHSLGGLGVTFMTGTDRHELDSKLHRYCTYKLHQQNSNIWIGLGDISPDRKVYKFRSMFFARRKKVE